MTTPAERSGDALAALLEQTGHGDQDAFARLYDDTAARIHGLVLRVVVDRALAEEVTQDCFLEIWRVANSYRSERGSALSWMFTIAHRRAVDRVRSVDAARRRDSAYGTQQKQPDFDSTSEQVIDSAQAAEVRAALSVLSDVQREAVTLAYFNGSSHTQVAAQLGIPVGTAKSRIRDGLLALRTAMKGAQ